MKSIHCLNTLVSMNITNRLIQALWSEFSGFIERGIPVYFTFTNDLIEEVLVREDIPFETGRGLVNSEVRELEPLSQNPFDYIDFENIWRTLSKEVFKLSHNPKCITFNFEQAHGANKAKRFPLSQALYSKEDVIRLIDKIGFSNLRSEDENYVYRCITSNKGILSGRGKRISSYVWMKDALVKQVKSLSESVVDVGRIKEILSKKTVNIEQLKAKIYVDNIDWLSSEYVINLFDQKNNLISDSSVINQFFSTHIFGEAYKVFIPSIDGDCWIISEDEYIPFENDEIIIVYAVDKKDAIKGLIIDYFNVQDGDISEDIIFRSKQISVFRFRLNSKIIKNILIKSGSICAGNEVNNKKEVIFKGGVCVNINQDRFSCRYLPIYIIHQNKEYKLTGIVKINDAIYDFDLFRNEVRDIMEDQNYLIELNESIKFKIKVASEKKRKKNKVIFPYYKKQVLPISTIVNPHKNGECFFEKMNSHKFKNKLNIYRSENNLVDIKKNLHDYQLINANNFDI